MAKKNTKKSSTLTPESSEALFKDMVKDAPPRSYSEMGELGPQERDLEQEIYGKKGIKQVIDKLEEHVTGKPLRRKANTQYVTKVFSTNKPEDRELLDKLLNDKQYSVFMWRENWTVHGDFKIFVIYLKNLDIVGEEEKKEEDTTVQEEDGGDRPEPFVPETQE